MVPETCVRRRRRACRADDSRYVFYDNIDSILTAERMRAATRATADVHGVGARNAGLGASCPSGRPATGRGPLSLGRARGEFSRE